MKRILGMLMFFLATFITNVSLADPPGPPPPGGNPVSSGGVPVGGPVGGGILILLALAVGYGAYRIYRIKINQKKEEVAS